MATFFNDSLLILAFQLQPYIPWSSVSLFVTVRMAFIHSLKVIIFVLTGELAVTYCLIYSFSSRYHNYFLEYWQPSILSKLLCIFLMLKFGVVRFGQRSVFQNTSHRETNLLSKHLYFQSSINYNEMRAATWSCYFFAKRFFFFSEYLLSSAATSFLLVLFGNNIFSNKLLLNDKYFFSKGTVSEEVFLLQK